MCNFKGLTSSASGLVLALAVIALAGCTTTNPAPVVDRTATSSRPLPPATGQTSAAPAPVVQPPLVTLPPQVTTRPAPAATISERGAPPSSAAATPAVVASAAGNTPGSSLHVVQRGETLYRIAVNNGLNVDQLAQWNGMAAGQTIREGQVIRLRPPEGSPPSGAAAAAVPAIGSVASDTRSMPPATSGTAAGPQTTANVGAAPSVPSVTEPRAQRVPYSDAALAQLQRGDAAAKPATPGQTPARGTGATTPISPADANAGVTSSDSAGTPGASSAAASTEPEVRPGNGVERDGVNWTWPTTGRVASKWSDRAAMKGIDIAARSGTAVVAAAPGKVIYVGKEPRGYGQMIVVSHAKETVSVYFHTDKVTVKEQQRVTLGQRIAEVSENSGNKIHFEVRRQGRPLDPLTLMPAR